MAIDLQNPTNIETGWRPPTQFQSPSGIGEILKNRLLQQEFQQKNIADAIKQYQGQRQDSAYAQALQNAGLTEGQDVSGLSSNQSTRFAQLLADRTPNDEEDAYKAALTNQAEANAYKTWQGDPGDANIPDIDESQYPPYRTEPGTGITSYRHIQRGAHGQLIINYTPLNVPLQPTTAQNQSQRQSMQSEKELSDAITMHALRAKIEAQQNTEAGRVTKDPKYQNVPYSDSSDWALKQKELDNLRQQRLNPALASDQAGGHTGNYGRPLGPSMGPYEAGKSYSGRRYLGGDPNDPGNWQ